MKVLLVLAAFVAVALCQQECDYLAREKVKHQWQIAYHHNRDQFGLAVWRAFFAMQPQSKDLFKRVNGDDLKSPEFLAHSARVLGGFDIVVSVLDDEATLNAELAHLKIQHDERGIPDLYFRSFYLALERVMHAMMGNCFNYESWDQCGKILFAGIR